MTIILIPCLKFLINLIIAYTTTNVSFYHLAFVYNIFVGFLFLFVFLFDVNYNPLDNTKEN